MWKVAFEDVQISSLRSVRVRVQKPGGYQTVACAPLRLYDLVDQQASTVALSEHGRVLAAGASEVDTLVTIFRSPKRRASSSTATRGNDEIRVRAVVTGLAASSEYFLLGGFRRLRRTVVEVRARSQGQVRHQQPWAAPDRRHDALDHEGPHR